MRDGLDTKDFWTNYVLYGIAIDKTNSIVPFSGLPREVATALAERLRLVLLVGESEYIFHFPECQRSRMVGMESTEEVAGNLEDLWASLVDDFKTLRLKEAIIPLTSFSYDTAKAIAAKLRLAVEIRDTGYYLYRTMTRTMMGS